jgi:hypothetical protein
MSGEELVSQPGWAPDSDAEVARRRISVAVITQHGARYEWILIYSSQIEVAATAAADQIR